MVKTLQITSNGNLHIATKAWSDFSATIPLIRSFSYGDNFPVEYPIFPGKPIRYHFIFYLIVGLLEKAGIRLDWALNSLSGVGFFLLLVAIYYAGKHIFKSKAIGVISVVLLLFNGSFGFIEFFKSHPLSLHTPLEIIRNNTFSSFGPYDGKIVSAFWSLNIFTNQRHLGIAYAAFISLILLLYQFSRHPKRLKAAKILLIGIAIGLFPFIHSAVFGMMMIALFVCALVYPKVRNKILLSMIIAALVAFPQFLYTGPAEIKTPLLHLGYLAKDKAFLGYVTYWFYNLGLLMLLAPIGFFLANTDQKKALLPFITLFVVGNVLQFTPDIPTNHKFFNLFVIGMNLPVALCLVSLWKKNLSGKIFSLLLLLPLTLTGIIDFFPIVNDQRMELVDIQNNTAATFIQNHTSKDATFLNSSFIYNPASLAGRKIFMGWPYFSWGAGYDTSARDERMKEMLIPADKQTVCVLLEKNNIDYVELQKPSELIDIPINYVFFENEFVQIYHDNERDISIYDVSQSCRAPE